VTQALTRVLVDTDVFSAPLDPHRRLLARQQAPRLAGRIVCVAAQTVAELRFGAIVAGWGPRRTDEVERHVARALVLWPDDDVVWAQARLRAACRAAGHALAHKVHTADLWTAATAVTYGLPLLSGDGIFVGVPGLTVDPSVP